jgi:hypothetical protein
MRGGGGCGHVDDALARTGPVRGQREYTLPTARSFAHMPTAFDHYVDETPKDSSIHCPSSTTDRLASRRRSQAAPGSYLNWKGLGVELMFHFSTARQALFA